MADYETARERGYFAWDERRDGPDSPTKEDWSYGTGAARNWVDIVPVDEGKDEYEVVIKTADPKVFERPTEAKGRLVVFRGSYLGAARVRAIMCQSVIGMVTYAVWYRDSNRAYNKQTKKERKEKEKNACPTPSEESQVPTNSTSPASMAAALPASGPVCK